MISPLTDGVGRYHAVTNDSNDRVMEVSGKSVSRSLEGNQRSLRLAIGFNLDDLPGINLSITCVIVEIWAWSGSK